MFDQFDILHIIGNFQKEFIHKTSAEKYHTNVINMILIYKYLFRFKMTYYKYYLKNINKL